MTVSTQAVADGSRLVDIGYHRYGLAQIRFSRCESCGTEYPHATGVVAAGHWLAPAHIEMAGPMCNGRPIRVCGCRTSELRTQIEVAGEQEAHGE